MAAVRRTSTVPDAFLMSGRVIPDRALMRVSCMVPIVGRIRRSTMLDLAYLILALGGFALMAGYAIACGKL